MTPGGEGIRALIVDDEPAGRAAIKALVAEDPEIEVVGECSDGRSALERIERDPPDLLFLDVQMPEMDGLTMLRRLELPQLPVVVFVTAYDQYALRAFEVNAVDYLLKPFDDDRFRVALGRAKRQVRQGRLGEASDRLVALLEGMGRPPGADPPPASGRYLRRLVIKSGGRVSVLNVREIDWVEAEGDYLKIHAGKAWHLLRETMKSLEQQLEPARFVRIHRSTIVNVERIKELQPFFRGEYHVILQDGTSLKLSRGYKQHLEAALGRGF
ncbi:MAG TPA: LytTR family DNA-binding domain-containing protein [Gemmatimonadales bacterium]|nr:LytTR family DNA-binding domain-containing protein [Gemmatimonadales bacterium]